MARSKAPKNYDPTKYRRFAVTVDMVVLTIEDGELQALLIERGEEPHMGELALPGGFVRPKESLDEAVARELDEETQFAVAGPPEQLGAYGDPDRDPRMRIVTVAYLAILREVGRVTGGGDARRAALVPVKDLLGHKPKLTLAFDHQRILGDAIERAREKLEATSLATTFLDGEFTMSELRGIYEAFWGIRLDPANFRRQVLAHDFVRPTNSVVKLGPEGGKPAETYRAGKVRRLKTPMTRPRSRDNR